MILAIDIGNSRIKLGFFDGEKLVARFAVRSVPPPTADEIYSEISGQMPANAITAIVVSSVVPPISETIRAFGEKFYDCAPLFVDSNFDFGLKIKYEQPAKLGVDRLVAAFAAVEKYAAPVIVCDFGTATTIDAVNSKNEFLGGVIAPGINTLSEALFIKTAQLPRVEIARPPRVIGDSTVSAIQSGIFYGYIGLTEGILRRMIGELGEKPRVVATGGFAELLAENCDLIELTDENLMLEGLHLVCLRDLATKRHQKNTK